MPHLDRDPPNCSDHLFSYTDFPPVIFGHSKEVDSVMIKPISFSIASIHYSPYGGSCRYRMQRNGVIVLQERKLKTQDFTEKKDLNHVVPSTLTLDSSQLSTESSQYRLSIQVSNLPPSLTLLPSPAFSRKKTPLLYLSINVRSLTNTK